MPAHADTTHPDGPSGPGAGARPRIAISMGDPAGIGAEIICKALAEPGLRMAAGYRVHGSERAMLGAARAAGITPFWRLHGASGGGGAPDVVLVDAHHAWGVEHEMTTPGPSAFGGAASFQWVEDVIRDAQRPVGDDAHADAIVTAPISKTSWNLAGHTRWPGHTELLAERFGAPRGGMLFVGPHLRVMLATIHVPLMDVGRVLTTERVLEAIELAHRACVEMKASRGVSPRVAVCGLNPHAGEGGILGSEDDRVIAPAVAMARAKGIDAYGPLPGDTVFAAAAAPPVGKGLYDCVVAMYHDQGLIPVKLVDGERAVNVTVGVPTIRTSPAHGTAFDIAGKNVASAVSMREAIEVAIGMVGRKAAHSAAR